MNDNTRFGGRANTENIFQNRALNEILYEQQSGYHPSSGMHIYCELRHTNELLATESDKTADLYLQIIQQYVALGIAASDPFDVRLLEVQNNILHFYKEAPLTEDSVLEVIFFVETFTVTVYEQLKSKMNPDHWRGFASCVDHGSSIILNSGNSPTSSTISLGPSANRPAKQLLSGNTPAGCLDVPGSWARLIRYPETSSWITLRLSDRQFSTSRIAIANAARRDRFSQAIKNVYKAEGLLLNRRTNTILLANRQAYADPEGFTVDRPYRMEAYCLRCDLDGFSATVERAFSLGSEAVQALSLGFAKLMALSDEFKKSIPGCVRLPWAGDCVTFLIPPLAEETLAQFREQRWLQIAADWQTRDVKNIKADLHRTLGSVTWTGWAIGAACGNNGLCLVAPIEADSRKYLIATGWSTTTALKAQERGKGNDVVIERTDYGFLPKRTKQFFSQIEETVYWKASNITLPKLQKADIDAGKSENQSPAHYLVAPNIHIPAPKPHFQI